jgi:SAM-dependent methyltransferase
MFTHPDDSHRHSLETLNRLYEYDDFMASIKTVLDLGCGTGDDLEWWATRTTRDEAPQPLNIQCTGVDLAPNLTLTNKYNNVFYQSGNFEDTIPTPPPPGGFDVLWCHDSFQYAHAPVKTLSNWWHLASPGAMLYLAVPVTQRVHRNQLDYHLLSGCYYHHTMVSLIYQLATAGWDCNSGFFKQAPTDLWIHAVVYKSTQIPQDPVTANWHTLSELGLLPSSAMKSIFAHNYLRQQDLVVPWVDHSLMSMAVK